MRCAAGAQKKGEKTAMENGTVTFSVIMPAYNAEAYVRDAVDSVLGQTYPHWELIAVNDGSADRTLPILEQYAASDARIKVFSKENGGYVSAVNCGLDKAGGDYVCFMGSDDRLSCDLFAEIAAHLTDGMPDMIAFKTVCCAGERQYPDAATAFDSFCELYDTDIKTYAARYPAHSAVFFTRDTSRFYKTRLVGELRYFGKYGMDADGIFSMLFTHRASSFSSVPVDGYYWTLREDSVSGRKMTAEVNADRIRNWVQFFDALSAVPADAVTPTEKKCLETLLYIIKQYSIQNGSAGVIRQGVGCARRNVKRYAVRPDTRTRLFLRLPGLYLLGYRVFRRFAG